MSFCTKMAEREVFNLVVTDEQKELIHAMWAHNGWEVELADSVQSEGGQTHMDSAEITDFRIEQDKTQAECQYCLCSPCITAETNRQLWWETEVVAAQASNSSTRKNHYKRFWTMLLHKGAWSDPRYKARKQESLRQDPNRQLSAWIGPSTTQSQYRDIMPDCVLKCVRDWLPNPPSQAYMGHKWC